MLNYTQDPLLKNWREKSIDMEDFVVVKDGVRPLRAFLVDEPRDEHEDAYNYFLESRYPLNPIQKEIFKYVRKFCDEHNALPSLSYVEHRFKEIQRSEPLRYIYDLQGDPELSFAEMRDHVKKRVDNENDEKFREILKNTMMIFKDGFKEKGGKEYLSGRADAMDYLTSNMNKSFGVSTHRNSGTLADGISGVWQKVLDRRVDPLCAFGLVSGFEEIDDVIMGGRAGELHFVLGFTGAGKSLFTLNWLYFAAYYLNRDVVLYSLEMDREQIMTRLLSMHSAHEGFRRIHKSVPVSKLMKSSELTDSEINFMETYVIPDLMGETEREIPYGNLHIEYPGENFTVSQLKRSLSALSRKYNIEAVVVDYPELMTPERHQKSSNYGVTMNSIIKDLKQFALNFNDGKGIFLLCPYQSNRDGFDRAHKNDGMYDLRAMSWASESERAADVIYSVYKDPENDLDYVKVCCLKNRRGAQFKPVKLSVDWKTGYMDSKDDSSVLSLEDVDWEE